MPGGPTLRRDGEFVMPNGLPIAMLSASLMFKYEIYRHQGGGCGQKWIDEITENYEH